LLYASHLAAALIALSDRDTLDRTSDSILKFCFHLAALSLSYELQYGKSFTGIKKAVFSGWQANTITVWQSGKPFTITETGSGADNSVESDGKQHGGARASHKTNTQFFNTAAFAPQPLRSFGNTQRNSLFGPDFRHVDLSIFKVFPAKERVNMQFRAESFNISNTPNYYIGKQ
jgi:hypothetical protein